MLTNTDNVAKKKKVKKKNNKTKKKNKKKNKKTKKKKKKKKKHTKKKNKKKKKRVDPDVEARNELFHQDLHVNCFQLYYWFLTKPLFSLMDVSEFRNGRSHFRYSEAEG